MPYLNHGRWRGKNYGCGRESVGRESGELPKVQHAEAGKAALKKEPTREINRGWFPLWFPDHRPDFGRMGRVIPNRRLH